MVSPQGGGAFRPWGNTEEFQHHRGVEIEIDERGKEKGKRITKRLKYKFDEKYSGYFFYFADPRHSETPSCYVSEIKSTLCEERSLSASNKSAVFETLERLSERLRLAESSRKVAMNQLQQLKRNYQVHNNIWEKMNHAKTCSYFFQLLSYPTEHFEIKKPRSSSLDVSKLNIIRRLAYFAAPIRRTLRSGSLN